MRAIFLPLLLVLTTCAEVDTLTMLLPELNSPGLELPKQLLSTKGACYEWTSSAPETLRVTPAEPTPGGCARQALVELAEPGPVPSSIMVTATDAATSQLLNIPARIRRINSIHIQTKSRMMNIREVQKLEIVGQDAQENTFTSLEGLRFAWTLVQDSKILETVSISQARLLLPLKTRERIEGKGYESDILVVRALSPGNLKVIAKCIEPGYEHVSTEIIISVHERFELLPGPILLMAPHSSLQLYLQRPSAERIHLPQAHYDIITCAGFTLNATLYLTVTTAGMCDIRV
jgi:hypothetical protein